MIDLIGNTPLIKLKYPSEITGCNIYGKAEFMNPGGSVKDRAALGIILDAEKNAEADKEFHELITLCNEAEHLVHSTRKAIKDAGDKLSNEESEGLEETCKTLEEAVKEKAKEKIKDGKEKLEQATAQLAQKLYPNPAGDASQAATATEEAGSAKDDNVVDADFKEVDEDK